MRRDSASWKQSKQSGGLKLPFSLVDILVTHFYCRLLCLATAQANRRRLPPEPCTESPETFVNVVIRLPDGRRLPPRRFELNNTVAAIYLYAEIATTELDHSIPDGQESEPYGQHECGSKAPGRCESVRKEVPHFDFDLFTARPCRLLPRVCRRCGGPACDPHVTRMCVKRGVDPHVRVRACCACQCIAGLSRPSELVYTALRPVSL
jgi:hypothetical protein